MKNNLEQYLDIVIKKNILDKSTDMVFNVFYDSKMKSNVITFTNPFINSDVFSEYEPKRSLSK